MIAVITHKDNKYFDKKGYVWLHVGKKNEHLRKEYLYDDSGDNISDLNKWYAELTGIYWLWKNRKDDIKGIVHYRRFFTKNPFCKHNFFFLNEKDINDALKKTDIIVPAKYYIFGGSNYNNYSIYHNSKDIDVLREVFKKEYPEYLGAFDLVMDRSYLYPYNMFIASAEVFDTYCEWLFGVIEKSSRYYDLEKYDNEQARIFGFLGERLFNIWLEKTQFCYSEKYVVQTDSSIKERFKRWLETLLKCNLYCKKK